MSCYEWETGTFILPSHVYPAFKYQLITAYNAEQQRLLQKSQDLLPLVQAHMIQAQETNPEILSNLFSRTYNPIYEALLYYVGRDPDLFKLRDLLATYNPVLHRWDLAIQLQNRITQLDSEATQMTLYDATIRFDDATCTVYWSIPENNHAVKYAMRDPLAQQFFRQLDLVIWEPETGGTLVYSNEYAEADGYGPRISKTYGSAPEVTRYERAHSDNIPNSL